MARTALRRTRSATLLAVVGAPTLAGSTPTNTWLDATDGLWSDASRWSLGTPPPTDVNAVFPNLLFDAVGSPYTITNGPTPLLGFVQNVLVVSPDITLDLTSRLVVLDLFDLRRGTLRLDGSIDATDVVFGAEATFIGANGADGDLYGRVVNQGRIELSGDYSLRIDTYQSGVPRTLVNDGVITINGAQFGGPRISADQLINHGVIELSSGTGSASNALRSAEFILNTGEIIMNGPPEGVQSFGIESDLTNSGVIRLNSGASLQLYDNVTTFVADGRVTGGIVTVGAGGNRDTIVEGPLRADGTVVLLDRAKIRGGVFTPGVIDVSGQGIEISGGLASGDRILFTNTSPQFSGPLSATSLRIESSTVDISGPAFIAGNAEVIGSSLALRDRASEVGSLSLFGSIVTIGTDAFSEKYSLRVFGNLTARSNSSILNWRGSVVVDGDLDWNATTGSRIETSLDVAGDALIRNTDIRARVHAHRATIGGVISGNPEFVVTEGPVVTQAGVIRPGGVNEYGRFAVDGDLRLGNGLLSRIELDLFANPNGPGSIDYFEVERGDAMLNAVLHILVDTDDIPFLNPGDAFTILTADAVSGEFLQLTHTALADGLFFALVYEPSAVRLVVVPSPGAAALLALSGLATTRRRRPR